MSETQPLHNLILALKSATPDQLLKVDPEKLARKYGQPIDRTKTYLAFECRMRGCVREFDKEIAP